MEDIKVIEKTKAFLKKHNQTQSWLAVNLSISNAQISTFLAGKYNGDVQNLETKLKNFMENFIANEDKSQDAAFFLETNNTRYVEHIMTQALEQVRLSVITGGAGYGKTTAIKRFIAHRPEAIFIKANNLMKIKDFLELLCKELNIKVASTGMAMFTSVVSTLSRTNKFIVIDEAEWLKDKTLDMVRNIWEESNTPIILCGTLHLKQNLKGSRNELDYVDSRITGRYTLENLSDDDIQNLCKHFHVDKDGAKQVKTLAGGNFRITMSLLRETAKLVQAGGVEKITSEDIKEASKMILD